MNSEMVRIWLVPVSTFITLITTSIAGWMALREYRLKVQAETRLARSAELEEDIKLIKLFTEMMNLAHARGGTQVSEKAIERILTPEMLKELGFTASNLSELLEKSVVNIPVGDAVQDAAICAVWALGEKHALLKPIAIQALESIAKFKGQVAEKYLENLRQGAR